MNITYQQQKEVDALQKEFYGKEVTVGREVEIILLALKIFKENNEQDHSIFSKDA